MGDPIEAHALGATLGVGREADRKLRVGSIKTNIGHCEGAAGVAGLIKTVLALDEGAIPRSLHCEEPNPLIDFDALGIQVQREHELWPDGVETRTAGVSSFGWGGTNCHVALTEAPGRRSFVLPLAADTPRLMDERLRHAREQLRRAGSEREVEELCLAEALRGGGSRQMRRESLRLAVTGHGGRALADALDAATADRAQPAGSTPGVVFACGGQGGQWVGMGRALHLREPAFASHLERCDAVVKERAGWSLLDQLVASTGTAGPDWGRTDIVQPLLLAYQTGMAEVWKSWGVEPARVIGASMGEIVAAHLAGAITLEAAFRVICEGSRLARETAAGKGGMAITQLGASEIGVLFEHSPWRGRICVAGHVTSDATVVAGDLEAIERLLDHLRSTGVWARRIDVDHAAHCDHMDALQDPLARSLVGLESQPPQIPVWSNVEGGWLGARVLGGEYWARNLRQPFLFREALEECRRSSLGIFVELGPHPTLSGADGIVAVHSGWRGESERRSLMVAVGRLFEAGVDPNWSRVYGRESARARGAELVVLSAQSSRALDAAASRLKSHLESHEGSAIGDVAYSSATTRTHHEHRLALCVGSRRGLLDALGAAANGETPALAARSRASQSGEKTAWLFAGQGSQSPGMGRGLYETWPAFRKALDAACDAIDAHLGRPLRDVMWAAGTSDDSMLLGETGYTQPALFALEWALSELWKSWGLRPDFVAGHSIGELVAACLAGVFSLEDAARLVVARGRLPALAAEGLRPDPMLESFARVSASVTYREPSLPLISNRTGRLASDAELMSAEYWVRHARETVRFADTVRALGDAGVGTFVELGPKSALLGLVPASLSGREPRLIPSFRAQHTEAESALLALGALFASGSEVDWKGVFPEGGRRVELPTYPWQRSKHWIEAPRAPSPAPRGAGDLYRVDWVEAKSAAARTPVARHWLVVADPADAWGDLVAERLAVSGASCTRVPSSAVSAALGRAPRTDHVVWIGGNAGAVSETARVLEIVQALAGQTPRPRLWLLTRHAVAVEGGEDVDCDASALWGFGRTLMLEHPELRCTLVDCDEGRAFDGAVTLSEDEKQVALRAGRRYVPRWERVSPTAEPEGNYRLETIGEPAFENLRLAAAERRPPGPTEVEIDVHACGLNFRDVLGALGMYPGDAGPLGNECAGLVTALGEDVHHLAVGDRVMALARGAMRRFVTVDSRLVVRVPDNEPPLSLEVAATLPVAFLTAWYALHELAALRPGERIVVHAAAGGVGMAAVQIARWMGATVLGTASPSKWAVVRSLGVEHVASSRDPSFLPAFRSAAGGADVVLNALTGEMVDASLSLLSAGGRFLEMGKTDIRDAAVLAETHPGVAYRPFDLWDVEPALVARMLREIVAAFASGHLRPLPVRVFGVTDAEAAFRWMAQARHVGKIALRTRRELRTDGTVLVTGGLGALGAHVARWLVTRGVRHVVLAGRRGLQTPGASSLVAELGPTAEVVAIDVADEHALRALLARLREAGPLRGVVHAAGVLDDGLLTGHTPERFAAAMAAKTRGAWSLHTLTRVDDLDLFVLFSSVAGTLGSAGQGPYAAANAYLDGLAAHRHALGLPALSVAWGPWAEGGMAASLPETHRARMARRGMKPIEPAGGIAMLERALLSSEPALSACPLSLDELRASFGAEVPPFWQGLLEPTATTPATATPATTSPPAGETWEEELASLPPARRERAVLEAVRSDIAQVLFMKSPEDVAADRSLDDLGFDSLSAIELRNMLAKRVSTDLPATLAFDYPTPAAIAKFLVQSVFRHEPEAAAPPSSALAPRVSEGDPIAIVGVGCRYPGGVSDPDSFWRLLADGTDAITEVPRERWDIDAWYSPDPDAPGKMTTRWGGFVEGLEEFEPLFFGLTPREAPSVDPQERLLLETTWEALEHVGLTLEQLMDSRTGVYMGLSGTEYQTRAMGNVRALDRYSLLGTAPSAMVGRLSYWLGLKGTNLAVDTACSSSLVAVHLACQALRNGECDLALAGGANVVLDPARTVYFSRLGAMSPTGRCHAFSAAADGYVRAEGAGVLVLERLADAERSGHRILAVVRGSAVNQDGRSNGLTAPNGPSQEAVIREALRRAGVEASTVGYLECHGTGTALGDPIEVQAAAAAYGEGRPATAPLVIGSVKTNFGHAEAAAGVASLIKVVLMLQHEQIPRTLHFREPNPHVAWDKIPVKVATEHVAWPRSGAPRRAGVSSFGFSGTNAHVVVEEGPKPVAMPASPARGSELAVLSAKTQAALNAVAERMHAHVSRSGGADLRDISFSLATTRSHHLHRLALTVSSLDELREALAAAARGETPACGTRGRKGLATKAVFVVPGQATLRPGAGSRLLRDEPAFREVLIECDEALKAHLGWSLLEELALPPERSRLSQIEVSRPAHFAVAVGLASLWRSWGVEPAATVGDGPGGLAAAFIAGGISMADAARALCHPAQRAAVSRQRTTIPTHATTYDNGQDARRDGTSHDDFVEVVRGLVKDGHTLFLELSAHPVLVPVLEDRCGLRGDAGVAVGSLGADSLGADRDERAAILNALGRLYVTGHPVEWSSVFRHGGNRVTVPTYPFQRKRYWLERLDPSVADG